MEAEVLAYGGGGQGDDDLMMNWDCPLCMEEMDLADQNFKPCPCGYQVCRFCWHRIREAGNCLCPACRRTYTEEQVECLPLTAEQQAMMARQRNKAKSAAQLSKSGSGDAQTLAAHSRVAEILPSRKAISENRVIQRNLVYVIGVAPRLANEVTLRSMDLFGQFGSIIKVVINKRNLAVGSASAYVTFARAEDAARAIAVIDGMQLEGKVLRCTYGTTKYCSYFLRGLSCPNPGCMYLHEIGEASDSYTKEQLSTGTQGASALKVAIKPAVEPVTSKPPSPTEIPAMYFVRPSKESDFIQTFINVPLPGLSIFNLEAFNERLLLLKEEQKRKQEEEFELTHNERLLRKRLIGHKPTSAGGGTTNNAASVEKFFSLFQNGSSIGDDVSLVSPPGLSISEPPPLMMPKLEPKSSDVSSDGGKFVEILKAGGQASLKKETAPTSKSTSEVFVTKNNAFETKKASLTSAAAAPAKSQIQILQRPAAVPPTTKNPFNLLMQNGLAENEESGGSEEEEERAGQKKTSKTAQQTIQQTSKKTATPKKKPVEPKPAVSAQAKPTTTTVQPTLAQMLQGQTTAKAESFLEKEVRRLEERMAKSRLEEQRLRQEINRKQ